MKFRKLLLATVICFLFTACSDDEKEVTPTPEISDKLLQTPDMKGEPGAYVQLVNQSYALEGEAFESLLDVVPYDQLNTLEELAIVNLNTEGAIPTLDSDFKLTWTPNAADFTAASELSVRVRLKTGDPIVSKISIPVYQKRLVMEHAVVGQGGIYADPHRYYLIQIIASDPKVDLNGTLRVLEFVNNTGQVVDRQIQGEKLAGVATLEVQSAPALQLVPQPDDTPAQAFQHASAAADTYPLKPIEDMQAGAFGNMYAESGDVKKGSVIRNHTNVFTSRKAKFYGYTEIGLLWDSIYPIYASEHQVFDYFSSCDQLSACKDLAANKAPIILIHGFTGTDNILWNDDAEGGQFNTFGQLAAKLIDEKHPVFEFRWHTYMRFEEAAGRLNQFTHAVATEMGRKPIILAHSFGGIVSTLAIQGKGIEYIGGKWIEMPYEEQVAQLITFNSPLSGINDETVSGKLITKKTNSDGSIVDFEMTRGRDLSDNSIGLCYSVTCVQAGAHLARAGLNLNMLQFSSALIADVPDVRAALYTPAPFLGNHDWKKKRIWAGEVIHKIQQIGVIPSTVKVLRFAGFRNLFPDGDKPIPAKAGDGLISLVGQAAYPKHFVLNPFASDEDFKYRFADEEYELYNAFDYTKWAVAQKTSICLPPSISCEILTVTAKTEKPLDQREFSEKFSSKDSQGKVTYANNDLVNLKNAFDKQQLPQKKRLQNLLPGECIKWNGADEAHVFPYIICARSAHTGSSNIDPTNKRVLNLLDFGVVNLGSEDAFIRHPLLTLIEDENWVATKDVAEFTPVCKSIYANNPQCAPDKVIYTAQIIKPNSSQQQSNLKASEAGAPAVLFVKFTHKETGAVSYDVTGKVSDRQGAWHYDVALALRNRFGETAQIADYRMWVSLLSYGYKPHHLSVENLQAAGADLGKIPLIPLGEDECPPGEVAGPEGNCIPETLKPSLAINFDPASQKLLGAQNMQAVTFVAGKNGRYAAKFGGVDNPGYIKIPNSAEIQFETSATFDLYARIDSMKGMNGWGRIVTDGGYAMTLLAKSHDRSGISFLATSLTNTTSSIWTAAFDPSMYGDCVHHKYEAVPIGTWVRVTYTMDSAAGVKGYLNKNLVWDCPSARPNFNVMNTRDLFIGKFSDTWYPLDGAIQDIRIYKKALTALEIQSLD